jgi:23S rRNA pseudouridine1911/1915/1917 synthase
MMQKAEHRSGDSHTLCVDEEHAGSRLDQYLAACLSELSRARAQALIHSGDVLINGNSAKPSHRVRAGELVQICITPPEPPSCEAEDIPLDIVYEDDDIIVVNKPAGMVVHPAAGTRSGTLVNALMAHVGRLPTARGSDRPGIVHRLDRNTTGLLIVAKTEAAHRSLTESIGKRAVERHYRALTYGVFTETAGTIDAPIGRSPSDRKKMAVTGIGSREAQTHFTVRETFESASHMAVRLSTGRTHQIRVHMAYIGHPVIGDPVYGTRLRRFHDAMTPAIAEAIARLRGHMLHAEILKLKHPLSDEQMEFGVPPPEEFADLLYGLRNRH